MRWSSKGLADGYDPEDCFGTNGDIYHESVNVSGRDKPLLVRGRVAARPYRGGIRSRDLIERVVGFSVKERLAVLALQL